jgi:tetratricopeptide (TPR) repeat protein
MYKNFIIILVIFSFTVVFLTGTSFAEPVNTTEQVKDAEEYFLDGEYRKAIEIYDDILEVFPTDTKIREMKAISLSNMRLYTTLAAQPGNSNQIQYDIYYLNEKSMLEFYRVLETDPSSVIALNGLGLGFGNFGEYDEAKKYFESAIKLDPDNHVSKNYLEYIEKIIKKYPYKPTEKPAYLLKFEENNIPHWIRNNASWWAADKISDNDFISGIQYLIENKIIKLSSQSIKKNTSDNIPAWIKNNAGWWATGKIPDEDFVSGLKYLIENGIIKINVEIDSELAKKELERKAWNFKQYLKKIQSDIKNEKRFIEYPNPSSEVMKKYWKDYHKWNLDQYLTLPSHAFPDPKRYLVDDAGNKWFKTDESDFGDADNCPLPCDMKIEYNVYVNDQPKHLPLDHVSTLKNAFAFWESTELTANYKGVKYPATVTFHQVNLKSDANVWVTWVIRNLGDGVLGHANLGKGVVEVALGGYGCDGTTQLFTINTVETIMKHELGHSLGFEHSTNSNDMMYPSIKNAYYAYCLLS